MHDTTTPLTHGAAPRALVTGHALPAWTVTLAQGALWLQVVQLLLFDWLPPTLRLGLAGLAALLATIGAVRVSVVRADLARLWWPALLTIAGWAASALVTEGSSDPSAMIQLLSFYGWAILFLGAGDRIPLDRLFAMTAVAVLVGLVIALTRAPVDIGGVTRPGFFGGGPHAAAMGLAGLVMALMVMKPAGRGFGIAYWVVLLLGLGLVLAYRSRTALLALLVFIALFGAWYLLRRRDALSVVAGGILGIAGSALLFLQILGGDINQISSGRLANYSERLDVFASRPLGERMFGQGAGSDLLVTDQWWWAAKVSHNDVLTALLERGWFGLVLFLATLLLLWNRTAGPGRAALMGLVVMMLLNGVATRPLAFVFVLLAMAVGTASGRSRLQ